MRKTPFNAHQFLETRMALSAFHFDILQDVGEYFSGGYFPRDASPFFLLPQPEGKDKSLKYEHYLNRLAIFTRGISDMIFFYYITQEGHEIQSKFLGDKGRYPLFDLKQNDSNAYLDPRILLDYLKLDPSLINDALKEKYGFDFELAATKVDQLTHTLKKTKYKNMTPAQAVIIRNGTRVLDYTNTIHHVIAQFLIDAGAESAPYYPQISQVIMETTDQVKNNLAERIKAATPEKSSRAAA